MQQPSAEQISELRSNFLQKLNEKGGPSAIHPADLDRIKSSDDWVRRFLLHHDNDMNLALNMMWDTCEWRRQFGTNDISESTVRMDYLIDGSMFSHGKDIDGCTLLIFKCKLHVKGQRDFEELKKCVVYWFERLEKECNGKPITVFFDMDGCGLSNMDMEYTKYLINLLKMYYPFFLNYILIYEMAWILNAAFKIIKSLLPEKAVAKMKFLNKSSIKDFVPMESALTCWGGQDDYIFSFVPYTKPVTAPAALNNSTPSNNKKVHFADGSPMSETPLGSGDKDSDGILGVSPPSFITFVKDGSDLSTNVVLTNKDDKISLSYKVKTTSPEKFLVRPSSGSLAPGQSSTVTIALLQGFQLNGLSKDKFLVMSMPIDSPDMSYQERVELWKNTSGKNVSQHKLRCCQTSPDVPTKNGDVDQNQISKLTSRISQLSECQSQLHNAIKRIHMFQIFTLILIVLMAIIVMYVLKKDIYDNAPAQECHFKQV